MHRPILPVFLFLLLFNLPFTYGQWSVRFADPSFTNKGILEAYSYQSGQLFLLTDTEKARHNGYIFVDPETGAKLSSFLLGENYGALLTPDNANLLIAGDEGTIRNIGKYDPETLALIEGVEVDLNTTGGKGGQFEPTPEGKFAFIGSDVPAKVGFVSKYDPYSNSPFEKLWTTGFSFKGLGGLFEGYMIPNGDVGIFSFYQFLNGAGTGYEIYDVWGLLAAETGEFKWTFTFQPPLNTPGQRLELLRYTFGSDGSFFAHAAAQIDFTNIGAEDFSKAKIFRIKPDGTLAYSKLLTVAGATVKGEYYFDGYALLYYTLDEGDHTQFIVVDPDGNVTGNAAISQKLSSGGDVTAALRSGTDFAFIRMSLTNGEETLARMNVTNGEMEFMKLPPASAFLGGGEFRVVTTPEGDPNSPFFDAYGFPGISGSLAVNVLNPLTSDFKVDLIQLPVDGSFPSCVNYTASAATPMDPLPFVLSDETIVNLEDEAYTASAHDGLPGLAAFDGAPGLDLTSMDPTVEVICQPFIQVEDPFPYIAEFVKDALSGVPDMVAGFDFFKTDLGFEIVVQQSNDLKTWRDAAVYTIDGGSILRNLSTLSEQIAAPFDAGDSWVISERLPTVVGEDQFMRIIKRNLPSET